MKMKQMLAASCLLFLIFNPSDGQFIFSDGPGRPTRPPGGDSTPTPPPPPPAFAAGGSPPLKGTAGKPGLAVASESAAGYFPEETWLYDTDCPNDRPPFGQGRWISANFKDCPAAILDPSLAKHNAFCRFVHI